MARINKIQKYAILWLSSEGYDVDYIVSETKLSKTQITNTITEQNNKTAEKGLKTKTSPVNGSRSKNLMITETSNKTRNVAVMTKEASQLNDDLKKNIVPTTKTQTGIYRPYSK
jgi:DNA-binding transcriptional regulator GbsR (MarR family)